MWRNGEGLAEGPRIAGEMGLKESRRCAQWKDPFGARHGANPTEGSVTVMSQLGHGIIRNRRIS